MEVSYIAAQSASGLRQDEQVVAVEVSNPITAIHRALVEQRESNWFLRVMADEISVSVRRADA